MCSAPERLRAVLHRDIDDADVERAIAVLRKTRAH
jgi:hypothetical protein